MNQAPPPCGCPATDAWRCNKITAREPDRIACTCACHQTNSGRMFSTIRIYRVTYRETDGISAGFSYHRKITEARLAARARPDLRHDIDVVEFRRENGTLATVISALNRLASHADNG